VNPVQNTSFGGLWVACDCKYDAEMPHAELFSEFAPQIMREY